MRRISPSVYQQRVDGGAALRGLALLGRPAEVEAAGELADDQAVHALEQLRLERRRGDELGLDGDRAQVGEQAEAAAEREQGLLGADRGVRVVPLRPADRAQEHGVGRAAGLDVLGPDGDAVGVDAGPADDELVATRSRSRSARPTASRTRHARRRPPPGRRRRPG